MRHLPVVVQAGVQTLLSCLTQSFPLVAGCVHGSSTSGMWFGRLLRDHSKVKHIPKDVDERYVCAPTCRHLPYSVPYTQA